MKLPYKNSKFFPYLEKQPNLVPSSLRRRAPPK
jgi:hypothetical protein